MIGSDTRLVVVDDAETANAVLEWLDTHRPTMNRARQLCQALALLHTMILVAQWAASVGVSTSVEGVKALSGLFFESVAITLHWLLRSTEPS